LRNLGSCHDGELTRAASTQSSRRGTQYGNWSGRRAWLVHDATSKADLSVSLGSAMQVLDVGCGEHLSESGMLHLSSSGRRRQFTQG
jgi:hypothetical protein